MSKSNWAAFYIALSNNHAKLNIIISLNINTIFKINSLNNKYDYIFNKDTGWHSGPTF